jgi:hypothetical protein
MEVVGDSVKSCSVGCWLGRVGKTVDGDTVGSRVVDVCTDDGACFIGIFVGNAVGDIVVAPIEGVRLLGGCMVGFSDGNAVCDFVGDSVGTLVGALVGSLVGCTVTIVLVGNNIHVGASVGDGVSPLSLVGISVGKFLKTKVCLGEGAAVWEAVIPWVGDSVEVNVGDWDMVTDGSVDGCNEPFAVGLRVGFLVGFSVGLLVGLGVSLIATVGWYVGSEVGFNVGSCVDSRVGFTVGGRTGFDDITLVGLIGLRVGLRVGLGVGWWVGLRVCLGVGLPVGLCVGWGVDLLLVGPRVVNSMLGMEVSWDGDKVGDGVLVLAVLRVGLSERVMVAVVTVGSKVEFIVGDWVG